MRYEAPDSLEGAVALLAGAKGEARVLAGGTDLLVQMRADVVDPELIVDIKKIAETRTVTEEKGGWRIGAAVTGAELKGDVAAGGMLVYLFVGYRSLGGMLFGPWTRIVREGLAAGFLGAAAVAIWFLLYDTAAGVPLRTPALLGSALFHGLRDPSALVIGWPVVLEYTLVHGAAFIAFGWMAAALLALADREPRLLFVFIMLFCCFEVFTFAMISVLAHWLLETIAWWTILAGNLIASVVMLGCFLRGHRVAWREFLHASL